MTVVPDVADLDRFEARYPGAASTIELEVRLTRSNNNPNSLIYRDHRTMENGTRRARDTYRFLVELILYVCIFTLVCYISSYPR